MPTIQVRNVPESTSRALKAKAALEGRSLSDYLLEELNHLATRPSRAEVMARIRARGSVDDRPPAVEVLAQARSSR